jgi:hypothetical protein
VAPLYGDDLNAAVRELVQNAVDACRELDDVIPLDSRLSREEHSQKSDVLITLDKTGSDWSFSISDRGIGMTPETVRDYFLKAGASFRNSEAWRSRHTSDGKGSRVPRSGRFGIGVLAAFLLGSEIEVSTRHVTSPRGIRFAVTLSDRLVELRSQDRPVGTTITIALTPAIGERLAALLIGKLHEFGNLPDQVYLFSRPKLAIRVNGRRIKFGMRWPGPEQAPMNPTWQCLMVPGYKAVYWNYSGRAGRIACNGLAVMQHYEWNSRFTAPNVSVIDPDGNFPLTLARNALVGKTLPFADELFADVLENLAAAILIERTTPRVSDKIAVLPTIRVRHPAILPDDSRFDYVFLSDGVTLADEKLLERAGVQTLVQYYGGASRSIPWPVPPGVGVLFTSRHARRLRGYGRHEGVGLMPGEASVAPANLYGFRHDLSSAALRLIGSDLKTITWDGRLLENHSIEAEGEGWICITEPGVARSTLDMSILGELLSTGDTKLIVEYHISARKPGISLEDAELEPFSFEVWDHVENTGEGSEYAYGDAPKLVESSWLTRRRRRGEREELLELLAKYLGDDLIIPYDIEERRGKFGEAFSSLAKHLNKHEQIRRWSAKRRWEAKKSERQPSRKRRLLGR